MGLTFRETEVVFALVKERKIINYDNFFYLYILSHDLPFYIDKFLENCKENKKKLIVLSIITLLLHLVIIFIIKYSVKFILFFDEQYIWKFYLIILSLPNLKYILYAILDQN